MFVSLGRGSHSDLRGKFPLEHFLSFIFMSQWWSVDSRNLDFLTRVWRRTHRQPTWVSGFSHFPECSLWAFSNMPELVALQVERALMTVTAGEKMWEPWALFAAFSLLGPWSVEDIGNSPMILINQLLHLSQLVHSLVLTWVEMYTAM